MDWHNPTSQSKRCALFVFFFFVPVVSFFLGTEYMKTVKSYEDIPELSTNHTLPKTAIDSEVLMPDKLTSAALVTIYDGNLFENKRFGFTLELPPSWNMKLIPVQEFVNGSYIEAESYYLFGKGNLGIISKNKLDQDPFCSNDPERLKKYIDVMALSKVGTFIVKTIDLESIKVYTYNPLDSEKKSYALCHEDVGFTIEGNVLPEEIKNVAASLQFKRVE